MRRKEARAALGRDPGFCDRVYAADGKTVVWRSWSAARCSEDDCGALAAVLWKDERRDPETWFYRECARCDSYLCDDHACDLHNESGDHLCLTCASAPVRNGGTC